MIGYRRCAHCGQSLPVRAFYLRKNGTPRSWCKACSKARSAENQRKARGGDGSRRKNARENDRGGVWCPRCRTYLPREAFRMTPDGLQSYCRACVRAYQREQYARKRQAPVSTRTCTGCGATLAVTEFYVYRATGKPHSRCKPCERKRAAENFRRAHSRPARETPVHGTGSIRAVVEYGHDGRCIVWETGPAGFCAIVTATHCPCEAFAAHGDCAHRHKAIEVLSTSERRAA